MITSDDRRVRAALIQTYDQFRRGGWSSGAYVGRPSASGPTNCLMGGIARHLEYDGTRKAGSDENLTVFIELGDSPLLVEIRGWFRKHIDPIYMSVEVFNDHARYDGVMPFLEARISELEHEMHKAAPSPVRVMATALLSLFSWA